MRLLPESGPYGLAAIKPAERHAMLNARLEPCQTARLTSKLQSPIVALHEH